MRLFLLFWIAGLFGLFVFFEYVYRLSVYLISGDFYTALTPSRFLTDLAYPLAIAAGFGLARITARIRLPACAPLVLAGALVWAFFPIRHQTLRVPLDIPAYRWVAANAETNALLASGDAWAAYFAQREVTFTPLPASEGRNDEYVRYKREVLPHDSREMMAFRRKTLRPLYVAYPAGSGTVPGMTQVFRGEQTAIYKLVVRIGSSARARGSSCGPSSHR